MITKQMMFMSMIFMVTGSCMPSESPIEAVASSLEKDFVFFSGVPTVIEGNDLWSYLNFERLQARPTPVFKDTKVVEFTKDNEFQEIGTLGSLEKSNRERSRELEVIRNMAIPRGSAKNRQAPNKPAVVAKFEKHAGMNNAIYCPNVAQVADYDGKLHHVGAIIYRTQNLERCAFYREYLAQQKLATKK